MAMLRLSISPEARQNAEWGAPKRPPLGYSYGCWYYWIAELTSERLSLAALPSA